jgi:hypothetical protein
MANPHKGEVELKAGETAYTLRFSIDAMCRLEETTGKGLMDLLVQLADAHRMTLTMVRHMLHAGLLEHHPEVTLKEAGEIMLAAGGMLISMAAVTRAIHAAFPEASGTPRPTNRATRRARGTGKVS